MATKKPEDRFSAGAHYLAGGREQKAESQKEVTDRPPGRLHIRAVRDGFRRAGRAWPAEGVTVPAADFTAGQIAQLRAEKNLVVTELDKAD